MIAIPTKINARTIRAAVFSLAASACTCAMTASAASATGQASIFLIGEKFTANKSISVSSEPRKVVASKRYTYKLTGSVKGLAGTPLAKLLSKPVALEKFVESVSPGGSKFLKGTVENPAGTLPVTLLDKKFAGSRKVKGLGTVKISFKVVSRILADGTCRMEVSQVRFSTAAKPKLGSIVFLKGSVLTVSAAPIVEFKGDNTSVAENAGTVAVNIWRTQNTAGPASVEFETLAGTANSSHYTVTSGRVVFANRDVRKTITIPIIDNNLNDAKRYFTIRLKNPGDGALLGSRTTTKVTITDNE